jgi:hypothetical protein
MFLQAGYIDIVINSQFHPSAGTPVYRNIPGILVHGDCGEMVDAKLKIQESLHHTGVD